MVGWVNGKRLCELQRATASECGAEASHAWGWHAAKAGTKLWLDVALPACYATRRARPESCSLTIIYHLPC